MWQQDGLTQLLTIGLVECWGHSGTSANLQSTSQLADFKLFGKTNLVTNQHFKLFVGQSIYTASEFMQVNRQWKFIVGSLFGPCQIHSSCTTTRQMLVSRPAVNAADQLGNPLRAIGVRSELKSRRMHFSRALPEL